MKRIISLILVLATAFLTLTGCAFRYDKKDMSKYAEFDEEKFYNELQNLVITLGSFSDDPTTRENQVKDEVAKALLTAAGTTKKITGTMGTNDSVYFCYYAVDEDNNILYASKLDLAKPTNIQLGLSTLTGVDLEFSKILSGANIQNSLYSTSSTKYVKDGDVVAVSYKIYKDDNSIEDVWHEYLEVDVDNTNNDFAKKLLEAKAQVGVELDEYLNVSVKEGDVTTVKKYGDVKVESILSTNNALLKSETVGENQNVNVSYVLSIDDTNFPKENGKPIIPNEFKGMNVDFKEKMTVTVSYESVKTGTTPGASDKKTFLNQLVGKNVGVTISSIVEEDLVLTFGEGENLVTLNDVDYEYSDVTVNWIVKTTNAPLSFTCTPFDAYDEAKKNEKTEKNIYGETIRLNGKKLTFYVYPVYYIDAMDPLAEGIDAATAAKAAALILKECYTTSINELSTAFPSLRNNDYKNGETGVTTLTNELATLLSTLSDKKTATKTALDALTTAQKNLAGNPANADNTADLTTKRDNATTTYVNAKAAEVAAEASVNKKIDDLLASKSGETSIVNAVISEYKQYHYDKLDAAYREDTRTKLAAAITDILKSSVTFKDNLPKRAVKQAYNSLMDAYQYDFYEGNFSTDSTNSTSVSNYTYYGGDFDAYLIATVLKGEGTKKDAKNAVMAQAKEAVKDVMYIYIFTQMVEKAWGTELYLTKEEKHNIKDNLEYQAAYYEMYYGYTPEYDLNEAYNGSQYDKVMGYLLTVVEITNEKGVKVDSYTNIKFNK